MAEQALTLTELNWIRSTEDAPNVETIPVDLARTIYSEILRFGPCYPQLSEFLYSFRAKINKEGEEWFSTQVTRILQFGRKENLSEVELKLGQLLTYDLGFKRYNTAPRRIARRVDLYPQLTGKINGLFRYNILGLKDSQKRGTLDALGFLTVMMWMSIGEGIFDSSSDLEDERLRLSEPVENLLKTINPSWLPWKPRMVAENLTDQEGCEQLV